VISFVGTDNKVFWVLFKACVLCTEFVIAEWILPLIRGHHIQMSNVRKKQWHSANRSCFQI